MPCNCGKKRTLKPPPLPIIRQQTKTQNRRLHFITLGKPVNLHEKIKEDVKRLGQHK